MFPDFQFKCQLSSQYKKFNREKQILALINPTGAPVSSELFTNTKTIAVIGCSSNPYRTSNHIARYIQRAGFRMIPVNPNEKEVLGEPSYDSLFDLPEELRPEMVDIFRNKTYCLETVQQIVEWAGDREKKPVIWTQLDVSTSAAKKLAEENGFLYVENRCLMVEHRKLG